MTFEPTAGLREFLARYEADDNEWWRLSTGDMQNLFEDAVEEMQRLEAENAVLRTYLSDDRLRRIAVEHGWPHEFDNTHGVWCCDEHRQAFYKDDHTASD